MKHLQILCLLLLFFQPLTAQLSDDFSDGNFTSNPTWNGDESDFMVNGDFRLQLNAATGSDTSTLYSAVEIPDSTVWEMEFKMDFAPSFNNRLRIYLQANTTNFPDVDGYFLEIGESGTEDALKLYRSDGTSKSLIATATLGALGADPAIAKIRIHRTNNGDWTIFANYENGNILNLEATGFDDTYTGGNLFFGLWCKYTTSNISNFSFDNIAITTLLPDVTAPQILDLVPLSLNELELFFNESLDSTSAVDVSNYLINNGIGNAATASWNATAPGNIILTLNNNLTNQTGYDLEIQNIKDQEGNTMSIVNFPFNVNFEPLEVINVMALSPTEIELEFNNAIDFTTGSLSGNYTIDNGVGNPALANVDAMEPFRVSLDLAQPLSNGTDYILTVENIKDEIGIVLLQQTIPFNFLIGVDIEPQDLIINEILFNPITGGSDYVEIYNRSDKFLDISDLFISNTQRTSGRDKDIETAYIMQPREYIVLTSNRDFVLQNYTVQNPDVVFENSLPGYNDAGGNVSIFAQYGLDTVMIDSFEYSEDFHYPLIDNKEGISLERISFDVPTQSSSNWHSASTLIGGGTPTYQNSQFRPQNPADEIFNIADKVFSPDGDGFKDFLAIDYNLETQGYLATINIFDAKGRLVKTLFQNELLGLEGTLKWNGLTNDGGKARLGIYIVLAEIFSPEKDVMQFKTTCVVGGKLD